MREADKTWSRVTKDYPNAVDHRGTPLRDLITAALRSSKIVIDVRRGRPNSVGGVGIGASRAEVRYESPET